VRSVFFKSFASELQNIFVSMSLTRPRRQRSGSVCRGRASQTPVLGGIGGASARLEEPERQMAVEVAEASRRMVEKA
jgi:hypothetical protein